MHVSEATMWVVVESFSVEDGVELGVGAQCTSDAGRESSSVSTVESLLCIDQLQQVFSW